MSLITGTPSHIPRQMRRTPLICLSGHHDIEQAQHFDRLIRKPCNAEQLEEVVKFIQKEGG